MPFAFFTGEKRVNPLGYLLNCIKIALQIEFFIKYFLPRPHDDVMLAKQVGLAEREPVALVAVYDIIVWLANYTDLICL